MIFRRNQEIKFLFHPIKAVPMEKAGLFQGYLRSEVLQVIDETHGVDHVLFMELITEMEYSMW